MNIIEECSNYKVQVFISIIGALEMEEWTGNSEIGNFLSNLILEHNAMYCLQS